ncbi:MAG: acyl-protein synthetase [Candidatus Izimaplasma sp.]|nr:acyl-protein synthetase [Candidatus Izimaplasma bacterium]
MKKKYVRKLFRHKNPYDIKGTNQLFTDALRENAIHHKNHSTEYKEILDNFACDLSQIKTIKDIKDIPFIPMVYFKRHDLNSMPFDKMAIKATSSGTSSGLKSKVGMGYTDLWRGFKMIWRLFRYHKFWSLKRVNYFIFGYEPTKHTDVVIMKSANGFTKVAPAKKRYYAIRWDDEVNKYKVDLDYMKQGLIKASKQRFPIRTLGFPAYTYFLLKEMKEEDIKLTMPKGSLLTIGGGWKQFYAEQVDKQAFYDIVEDVLGIKEDNIVEFFGAVEHPVVFPDCKYHHLHVPIYSRVLIRDPETFEPLKKGEIGLVNLLSPLNQATPLTSVMTDDLGILHEGCECGLEAPWLEIIGRVGITDIKTCAQGAQALMDE